MTQAGPVRLHQIEGGVGRETERMDRSTRGAVLGIAAAAMFGASAPLAKRLLGDVSPQLLAGLLYGGAALALSAALAVRRSPLEARLRRSDAPTMAAVTMLGGVIAPVLLLVGLDRVSGVAGSLLLNLEAVLTLGLALVLFGEHLDRRAAAGAAAVVAAAVVLGVSGGQSKADIVGILAITAACACWAIDNNLTQRLSGRDPVAIVRTKAVVAAAMNIGLAFALGSSGPAGWVVVAAMTLGAGAYGLSVVFDAYALRFVGAAREAAFFATAPVFGVATAVVVLGESVGLGEGVAIAIMGVGIYLLVSEDHLHDHAHEVLHHDHRHRHDDGHHDHLHLDPVDEHAHSHHHVALSHNHRHVSDAHHHHRHDDEPGSD